MKSYELADIAKKLIAADVVPPTQTRQLLDLMGELADCSRRPLKRSREVAVIRLERQGSTHRRYARRLVWCPCDGEGRALTPTGRLMTAEHDPIAWR